MEFCGGHTHAIFRYGLQDLLPAPVEMVHGPGCPVCVLPVGRLDMAMKIAEQQGVILATYGDMLRVPGVKGRSLLKAKAEGADIRMVYSAADAVELAARNPDRQVVFLAIGSRPPRRRPHSPCDPRRRGVSTTLRVRQSCADTRGARCHSRTEG